MRNRPCKKVTVFGTDFLNSTNLTCHVTEFKVFIGRQLRKSWVLYISSICICGALLSCCRITFAVVLPCFSYVDTLDFLARCFVDGVELWFCDVWEKCYCGAVALSSRYAHMFASSICWFGSGVVAFCAISCFCCTAYWVSLLFYVLPFLLPCCCHVFAMFLFYCFCFWFSLFSFCFCFYQNHITPRLHYSGEIGNLDFTLKTPSTWPEKCNGHFGFMLEENCGKEIINQSSVFKLVSVHTKTQSRRLKFLRFEERW